MIPPPLHLPHGSAASSLSGFDPWGPVFRVGDVLARGHKGALLTTALGAAGLVPDRAGFAGAYAGGKAQIDAWAEYIDLAEAARRAGVGQSTLTPFAVGALVGAGVLYLALR